MKKMHAHPDHRAVVEGVIAVMAVFVAVTALMLVLVIVDPPGLLLLPFVFVMAYWVGEQMDKAPTDV
jgi:hypothetical protein